MKTKSIPIFTLSTLLIISCAIKSNSHQTENLLSQTEEMKIKDDQSLESKIEGLKNSMLDYMKTADASYTEKDVDECVSIMKEYLVEMTKTHSKEEGAQVVKATILKLNDLNNRCGSGLIETAERETIAEIIIIAGNRKGYNSLEEDITEAWREW